MIKKLFILLTLLISANFYGSQSTNSEKNSLNQMREVVKSVRTWHFPYPELINDLQQKQESSILIFTYGSLMDIESASRTLSPESLASRRPAIAYDLKRVFDRDVAIQPQSKWGIPHDPNARGMLNVWPSKTPGDFINGVLIEVTVEDIPLVLFRETGYDLIPVIVQDWKSSSSSSSTNFDPTLKIAYTFYSPVGSQYTNADITPRPGYYELTRDAAGQYGPLFSSIWIKTTYMADGITPISDWELQVQNGDSNTGREKGN